MKSLKKILSIFAAFMMVVGLTMTNASAASTAGTITVNNADSAATYTAYKILDAAIDTDDSVNTTYSIKSNSEWYDFVKNSGMFTLTAGSIEDGVTTYYVTANAVNAADLAEKISAYLKEHPTITGTQLTYNSTDKTASVSGLALGYYFVSSTTGALCNLTTNNPNAQINDKNESHFEKSVDKANVAIGDTVTYTIKGIVPDTTGFTEYTYKISDTMTNGLTFNATDVNITIDGTPLVKDTDYTYTPTTNGFEVEIDVTKQQAKVNKEIVVTYSATVNSTAFEGTETNEAKLTRGPGTGEEKKTETVKVFNSQIEIKKVDGSDSKALEGAKFVLKNEEGKFYQLGTNPVKVNWVNSQDEATEVETDKDGKATFNGLENGNYQLIETKAPDGYNLKTDPTEVEIKDSEASETFVHISTIENNTGTQLPSTGGMGTTMLYVAGAILMVGAAIIFVTNKRMKHE